MEDVAQLSEGKSEIQGSWTEAEIHALKEENLRLREDKRLANELCGLLSKHCGEAGDSEGAVDTLERLLKELKRVRLELLRILKPAEDALGQCGVPLEIPIAGGVSYAPADRVRYLAAQKDGAYAERNQVLALLARMAVALRWRVGVGQHPEADTTWEKDWRTILFVELPTGQCSWHFHDSEAHLLAGLPAYEGAWDGHTTPEKYDRVRHALRGGVAQVVEHEPAKQVEPWKGSWPRPLGYSIEEWRKLDEEGHGLVWFMRMSGGAMGHDGDGRRTLADVDLELRQYVVQQMEKVKGFTHFGAHLSQTDCARQISDFQGGLNVERLNRELVTCPECRAR